MKKIAFLLTFVAALFLISCDNETPIVPSDISNVRAEPRPGGIFLQWDKPADMNFDHVRITWFDPLHQVERFWLSSIYGDTLLIPDTRAKFGTYTFTLQTVSVTGTKGTPLQITSVSLPAPITTILGTLNAVPLTAEQLSTNAQDPGEGPIANLVDGNAATFFHSSWRGDRPPMPHWIQVDLGVEVTTNHYYRIWTRNRAASQQVPVDFDLLGSMDGDTWFLLRNFTQAEDDLNTGAGAEWTSESFMVTQPFRYIRYSVNVVHTGNTFFNMSGFRFYVGTVTIIDPENP